MNFQQRLEIKTMNFFQRIKKDCLSDFKKIAEWFKAVLPRKKLKEIEKDKSYDNYSELVKDYIESIAIRQHTEIKGYTGIIGEETGSSDFTLAHYGRNTFGFLGLESGPTPIIPAPTLEPTYPMLSKKEALSGKPGDYSHIYTYTEWKFLIDSLIGTEGFKQKVKSIKGDTLKNAYVIGGSQNFQENGVYRKIIFIEVNEKIRVEIEPNPYNGISLNTPMLRIINVLFSDIEEIPLYLYEKIEIAQKIAKWRLSIGK